MGFGYHGNLYGNEKEVIKTKNEKFLKIRYRSSISKVRRILTEISGMWSDPHIVKTMPKNVELINNRLELITSNLQIRFSNWIFLWSI